MISVQHLTKYYGSFLAVDDLSFEIEDGQVYGFLGPNGAGKSTTMNIMTGCLSASRGEVKIGGYDILDEPEKAKALIGYLPEIPPLYLNETPLEYLRFVAEAKGLKGEKLNEQLSSAIEKTGISAVRNKLISTLSKGYRQRVGIAQALIGDPQVIILDEPTVGLDPIQIIEIRDLIRELGKEHTVILSSHILSEVQAICRKVLIIAHGKLVAFDTPDNLEKLMQSSGEISFVTEGTEETASEILSAVENISSVEFAPYDGGAVKVTVKTDSEDSQAVSKNIFFAFADKKIAISELSVKKANLEDVFLQFTESEAETEKKEDEEK